MPSSAMRLRAPAAMVALARRTSRLRDRSPPPGTRFRREWFHSAALRWPWPVARSHARRSSPGTCRASRPRPVSGAIRAAVPTFGAFGLSIPPALGRAYHLRPPAAPRRLDRATPRSRPPLHRKPPGAGDGGREVGSSPRGVECLPQELYLHSLAADHARHLDAIRRALRSEHKLRLRYADKDGNATERRVWPVALGFFAEAEVLAAWCEMRRGFRHFRLDRIATMDVLDERLPRRRRLLLAEWRLAEGVEGPT